MTTAAKLPAPASAEARATKVDRVQFLEKWSLEHPLATIEAGREAVREKFGISLGTKIISDTLRNAKALWEAQRLAAVEAHRPLSPPSIIPDVTKREVVVSPYDLQAQLGIWRTDMKRLGVRLLELLPDGNIRIELSTPTPPA